MVDLNQEEIYREGDQAAAVKLRSRNVGELLPLLSSVIDSGILDSERGGGGSGSGSLSVHSLSPTLLFRPDINIFDNIGECVCRPVP